jgi:hypothetical protein
MTAETEEMESHVIPAGTYWVGDPGYAFADHDLWLRLLDSAWTRNEEGIVVVPKIMEANTGDASFVSSGTAYGDGTYPDDAGHDYPVDSGMVGVTPAREGEKCPEGLHEITFDAPFTVSYDEGDIVIGHLTVETDPKFYCDAIGCGERIEQWQDYCDMCQSEMEEAEEDTI